MRQMKRKRHRMSDGVNLIEKNSKSTKDLGNGGINTKATKKLNESDSDKKMQFRQEIESIENLSKSKKKRLKRLRNKLKFHNTVDEKNKNSELSSAGIAKYDISNKGQEKLLKTFTKPNNSPKDSQRLKIKSSNEKIRQKRLNTKLDTSKNSRVLSNARNKSGKPEMLIASKSMKIKSKKNNPFNEDKSIPTKINRVKLKNQKIFDKLTDTSNDTRGQKTIISLRQRMIDKLKAARFRFLNEEIYTADSKEAQNIFHRDPEAFKAYHDGYRQQVKRWPLNPLDNIMKSIQKMPKSLVVADFGCGDARLSRSISQKVLSFDLIAINNTVTACDISKLPLEDGVIDIAVFCLSLMGTNLGDYLMEANRVLKDKGILKIAEVESRFEDVDKFITDLQHYGYKNTFKDLSHNLFYFLDFKKQSSIRNKKILPQLTLLPCLYKKR